MVYLRQKRIKIGAIIVLITFLINGENIGHFFHKIAELIYKTN